MKWTSLLVLSAAAIVVPSEALAIKPTGDSLPVEKLALRPNNNFLASSATGADSGQTGKTDANASAELQALEKRFFRHDFTSEPMDERLTRMEKFTFGETNKGSDQARLSRIASVLETHSADTPLSSIDTTSHKIAMAPPSSGQTTSQSDEPAAAPDEGSPSDYPHITYLEDELLGQHFGGSLESRLARLETKAFGSPSKNPDMSARTDALERYAEIKLHKKAFDQPVDAPEAPRRPRVFQSFGGWSDMGNARTGMSPMGAGQSYDSDPTMPSMGGSDSSSAPSGPPPEDPLALLPAPPAEGARLLSRVAWCEQHVFHRTYPELHLLARLHQLNATLNPTDKEKDIQLMDHVDTIVKEVVMRQHPPTNPS